MTSKQIDNNLVFLPLGGTGEIGMNCNVYGYGASGKRDWIMIDLGVSFGHDDLPGIELIMANVEFIEKHRKRLKGLVLTHGHEDHIGAVAHLWPRLQCPIYATPFTAELVRNKLSEAGLLDVAPLHEIKLGQSLDLGPFHLDFIGLTHSIAEMQAVSIQVGGASVLHTGDWKIDPDPVVGPAGQIEQLIALGDAGVDAIICDSTNVMSPGRAGSETGVAEDLRKLIGSKTGRVAITTFASNVARLASIGAVAREFGRHVTLAGRGMHRIFAAAQKTGYLQDFPALVPEEEAGYLPPEKSLILCTGSQGEPRAALARIAGNSHPHLTLDPGDCVVFSSKMIPGNEVGILALQNLLAQRDIEIVTASADHLHVSGHPCRDELIDMYDWVKPRTAIPVHGEARHLYEHAALARSLGVETALTISNGDMVRLFPGPAEVIDKVINGRVYMDGKILINADSPAVSQRRKLSQIGIVSVAIAIDAANRLCSDPEINISGMPLSDTDGILLSDWVVEAIERVLPENGKITPERAEKEISQSVRRMMATKWGKKPIVHVLLLSV